MRSRVPFFAVAFGCLLVCATRAQALEIISFGPSPRQSKQQLVSSWEGIPDEKRAAIQSYLIVGLGLSSTGTVRLIGVYRESAHNPLLHFQHLDLHGARLVWSVLIDPTTMRARVIFHYDEARVSDSFVAISKATSAREEE